MPFTFVTVVGTYTAGDGVVPSGTVVFTPTSPLRNGSIVITAPVVGRINASGQLKAADGITALTLAATTDPATQPSGATYEVVEFLGGADRRSYEIVVPHTAAPLDLAYTGAATATPMYGYELVGASGAAASAAIATHVGATDPHTQYLTNARGDTRYQALDSDLTTIAAISATTSGMLATDGAGWLRKSYAAVKTALGLSKADVGLDQVDNTSDNAKPLSSAASTALNARQPLNSNLTTIAGLDASTAGAMVTNGAGWLRTPYATLKASLSLTKADVGLGSVDNVADLSKPVSTAQQAAIDASAVLATQVQANPQTAGYTLVLADAGRAVEVTSASAVAVTVPTNATVAFPIGTVLHVTQLGAGQVTVTPAAGVTITGTPGLKTRAQNSEVKLRKRATNTWLVTGDSAP